MINRNNMNSNKKSKKKRKIGFFRKILFIKIGLKDRLDGRKKSQRSLKMVHPNSILTKRSLSNDTKIKRRKRL